MHIIFPSQWRWSKNIHNIDLHNNKHFVKLQYHTSAVIILWERVTHKSVRPSSHSSQYSRDKLPWLPTDFISSQQWLSRSRLLKFQANHQTNICIQSLSHFQKQPKSKTRLYFPLRDRIQSHGLSITPFLGSACINRNPSGQKRMACIDATLTCQ